MYLEIRCSRCNATFRVDGDHIGQTVTCHSCGAPMLVPRMPGGQSERPDLPATAHDDIWPAVSPPVPANPPPRFGGSGDRKPSAKDTFWMDLLRLLLPARDYREWITFLFIVLMVLLCLIVREMQICCCATWIFIVLVGYVCSFLFLLARTTAAGDYRLPYPGAFRDAVFDLWRQIIDPLGDFLISFLYVFLPALAVSVGSSLMADSATSSGPTVHNMVWVCAVAGLFCWPMVIFVIVWGNASELLHPIRLLRSIQPILGPYLVAWMILVVTAVVFHNAGRCGRLLRNLSPHPALRLAPWLVTPIIVVCVTVYAARTVGLLYRHYGHRIPWNTPEE